MDSIANILKTSLQQHGLGEAAFSAMLIARANKHLADFMGDLAIKNIRFKKIAQKVIYIEITSAVWAQEFHFYHNEFLKKIRQDFPDRNILDIKIKILGKEDLYDNFSY